MNKCLRDIVLKCGACLLLVGAAGYPLYDKLCFYIYTIGAFLFAAIQFSYDTKGHGIVVRRLYGQQQLGAFFLLIVALLMSMQTFSYGFARRNEWLVALAIACVLQLYAAFRIPVELEKEQKKQG